jgi:hypothetical protein
MYLDKGFHNHPAGPLKKSMILHYWGELLQQVLRSTILALLDLSTVKDAEKSSYIVLRKCWKM